MVAPASVLLPHEPSLTSVPMSLAGQASMINQIKDSLFDLAEAHGRLGIKVDQLGQQLGAVTAVLEAHRAAIERLTETSVAANSTLELMKIQLETILAQLSSDNDTKDRCFKKTEQSPSLRFQEREYSPNVGVGRLDKPVATLYANQPTKTMNGAAMNVNEAERRGDDPGSKYLKSVDYEELHNAHEDAEPPVLRDFIDDMDDPRHWLQDCVEQLTDSRVAKARWPVVVSRALQGRSLTWYRYERKARGGKLTWPQFKEAFLQAHLTGDRVTKVLCAFRNLRFVNMEQMVGEMRKLDMQSSIANLSQEILIDKFLTSLPKDKYTNFYMVYKDSKPKVLEHVLQAALDLERLCQKSSKHKDRVGRCQEPRNASLRPVHRPPKPPSGGGSRYSTVRPPMRPLM
ncbi:hypothetical protein FA10DRAFT_286043 [Acaromyces ingoldii]|uniref:Retrotransposon gag domain-containing protein n=1 Tax=Acaromyces ingoldii TaxID=215250 RepID=A0A316YQM1_9BASI|nr:hypothetical protein FA10DRAFT_286043 [Acaromyces ingoldii]PWN90333.1 hypothetical protein FA10DRAFT_286043 [Acaromyces ingoldii]